MVKTLLHIPVCLCLLLAPARLAAEDSDLVRPYFHIRRGEFNFEWGLQDMWGLGGGVNLNRHWGLEVAIDNWDDSLVDPVLRTIGEQGVGSFTLQGRFRYPLVNDKLVPYAVAGLGGVMYQFNDRKPNGFGHDIDADRSALAGTAGLGLDWYVADNIALNLEGKYLAFQPVDIRVDDREYEYDASNFALTLGLRVMFRENHPRPLVGAEEKVPVRMYFGMHGGGSFLTDGRWTSSMKLIPEASAWGGVMNQHFGLTVGADFGPMWGVELAGQGCEYTMVHEEYGGLSEYGITSVIPQVRIRYPLAESRWVPYFATGMGVTYGEDNDVKAASEGHQLEGKGIYPAFTVGGGIEYFVARNISVGLDSRWLYTWNHEYTLDGVSGRGDFSSLQLLLGMRLYFVEF